MIETNEKKSGSLLPVPFAEVEEWPTRVQEFFDMVARRPFELLGGRSPLFGREMENWFKSEAEIIHPVYVRLFEAEDALLLKAEVPGFTEKELNITVEPSRVTITGKREAEREIKGEKKEMAPVYSEKSMNEIYRSVRLPVEIKAEHVKAVLRNGILELTLPKLETVKKVHVDVKTA